MAVLLLATANHAVATRNVTLAWNPSPTSSVSGYHIYTLEENAVVATKVTVGPATQALISGLKEGLNYQFTVTAYDQNGAESVPSQALNYFVPVPLQIVRPAGTPYSRLRFPISPGRQYELQASSDLKVWTTIWQTSALLFYTEADYEDRRDPASERQFYRLVVR